MSKPHVGISTRTLVAIALVVASFISSFALSRAANRTVLMWSARSVLLPGTTIRASDLVARSAGMPSSSKIYVSQKSNIVGFQILRPIGAGEFIPANAINESQSGLDNMEVPLSVLASDLPTALITGEQVNLYHVEERQPTMPINAPTLILAGVYIVNVDQKSQNLSSAVSLTLSVPRAQVSKVLAFTNSGRVVVVRLHG